MDAPTLTHLERLSLANQFDILAGLHQDEAVSSRFSLDAKILRGGHEEYYQSIFEGIAENIPRAVSDEVHNVLNMFDSVAIMLRELPRNETASLDRDKLTFKGFDADCEQHYEHTKLVIEDMKLYQELKDCRLGTPKKELSRYRRMLPVYQKAMSSSTILDIDMLRELQAID